MKYYRVEPTYKKSVVEYRVWRKDNLTATQEIGWRWGSFVVHVPENEEDMLEWVKLKGCESIEAYRDEYGLEDDEEIPLIDLMPNENLEWVDMDDYVYDMIETWDGCWEDWSVYGPNLDDDDEKAAIVQRIEECYEENWEDGLYEDGWEEVTGYYEIHTQVSVVESDESGYVEDEQNG
jgi:hypothetical protein